MVFLRNKPQAADLLSDSQPIIEDNFNTSDTVFGIDHYQFSDTTGNIGFHKIIHQTTLNNAGVNRTRSGVGAVTANFPTGISNIEQIFAAQYTPDVSAGGTADTQLFAITGNGGVNQLTGNFANNNGWCWCGGILIQWGRVAFAGNNSHENGTVIFQTRVVGCIPFPNNIFSLNATLQVFSSGATTASDTIAIRSFSTTQFIWVFNSSSSTGSTIYPGFYWMAIGN